MTTNYNVYPLKCTSFSQKSLQLFAQQENATKRSVDRINEICKNNCLMKNKVVEYTGSLEQKKTLHARTFNALYPGHPLNSLASLIL